MARKKDGWVHPLKGECIGVAECESCSAPVDLKVNKNGCVYYWCRADGPDGRKCFKRETWGSAASAVMIGQFEGKNHGEKCDDIKETAGQGEGAGSTRESRESGDDARPGEGGAGLFGGFFG